MRCEFENICKNFKINCHICIFNKDIGIGNFLKIGDDVMIKYKSKEKLRVKDCILCNLWELPQFPVGIHVYYYSDKFAILDCPICSRPMVTVSEHTRDVGKELWGWILKECRDKFGRAMRITFDSHVEFIDHFHGHIEGRDKY